MFSVKKRKDMEKALKISKIPPCPLVFAKVDVYNRSARRALFVRASGTAGGRGGGAAGAAV